MYAFTVCMWHCNTHAFVWKCLCAVCKIMFIHSSARFRAQELCEKSRWPSWAVRPNEPSGFRGRKAILNHASALVSACP